MQQGSEAVILAIGDWVLEVAVETNMEYSSKQAAEHCSCGYCRNFYQAIDSTYPNVRPFLAQFGLNVEGPDELSPFEPTIYEATYVVNGSILQEGTSCLVVNGIPVRIECAEDADLDTERPMPYFAMTIGLMELPWVLDEPMDEVVSPANEEAYMRRMWKKLLKRADQEEMYS